MNKQISLINETLLKNRYSQRELKGLEEDLDSVYRRLTKHEYSRGSFSRNKFDIPDKVHEVYVNIKYYAKIGQIWATILKIINANSYTRIADICPGFSPKVELGLHFIGFTGEVILIDQDKKSLAQLKHFLDLYNVKFKTVLHIRNVFGRTYRKFDLVTANHVLDDLTLNYFSQKLGIKQDDIYQKEGVLTGLWKTILSHKSTYLPELSDIIVKLMINLLKPGGMICLFEYKSYSEKILDLHTEYLFTRQLLRKVVSGLVTNGFLLLTPVNQKLSQKLKGNFLKGECIIFQKPL
jgi:hypothetical protein